MHVCISIAIDVHIEAIVGGGILELQALQPIAKQRLVFIRALPTVVCVQLT